MGESTTFLSNLMKKTLPKPYTSANLAKKKANQIIVKLPDRLRWTKKQQEFLRIAQNSDTKVMFVKGPAGVSKTFISVYCSLIALQEGKVSDIIYIRSVIESASKGLGFLPGEAGDKLAPYLAPFEDKLKEFLTSTQIKFLKDSKIISGQPVNYLRGSHLAGKYILVDESQNYTRDELKTIITRVGDHSKIIFMGDPEQSDLPAGKSGFSSYYNAFEYAEHPNIPCFEFTRDDIVRSKLLKSILAIIDSIED